MKHPDTILLKDIPEHIKDALEEHTGMKVYVDYNVPSNRQITIINHRDSAPDQVFTVLMDVDEEERA